jgi:hypothetical protein
MFAPDLLSVCVMHNEYIQPIKLLMAIIPSGRIGSIWNVNAPDKSESGA